MRTKLHIAIEANVTATIPVSRSQVFHFTLDGEDSTGADSGRLLGGTGGGTGTSSVPLVKLIDDTEADPVEC